MVGALGGALSLYLGETYFHLYLKALKMFCISNLSGIALALLFELCEFFMDIIEAIFDSHLIKKQVASGKGHSKL